MTNRKLILIIFQNSKLFKIFIFLNASNSLSSNFSLPKKFVYFKFKIPSIQISIPLKLVHPSMKRGPVSRHPTIDQNFCRIKF